MRRFSYQSRHALQLLVRFLRHVARWQLGAMLIGTLVLMGVFFLAVILSGELSSLTELMAPIMIFSIFYGIKLGNLYWRSLRPDQRRE